MTVNENLTEDILDLLVQAGGRITLTDLVNSLRQHGAEQYRLASGRAWRLAGNSRDTLAMAEALGFTVELEYTKKSIEAKQQNPNRSLSIKTTWLTL